MASEPKGRILFRPILETRPGDTIKPGDIAHIPAAPPPGPGTPPTIDAIIRRTREAARRWRYRRGEDLPAAEGDLPDPDDLAQRERELRQREYIVAEHQRELEEDRMLLAAREQQWQRRLEQQRPPGADQGRLQELQRQLHSVERRNQELEEALQLATQAALAEATSAGDSDIMAEREAFIEESENALFEKAMELQELETQLAHIMDELKAVAEELGVDWATLAGALKLPQSDAPGADE
ncbi:MAG: hypothetical protein Q7P63_15905 [Verrucomicrobiota bacterium JB022]|nr:hypothetical protein [Verrucomicrobiota bacterium JB022]